LSPCYCRIFCLFLLLSLPSLFKVIEQNGERSCFETSSLKQFVATIWLDVTIEGWEISVYTSMRDAVCIIISCNWRNRPILLKLIDSTSASARHELLQEQTCAYLEMLNKAKKLKDRFLDF
jgi:hypothetical protein